MCKRETPNWKTPIGSIGNCTPQLKNSRVCAYVCLAIHPNWVAPIGLPCSRCLQIQSQLLAITNMNSKPDNRNLSDSFEVQSKISGDLSLYIAVCLKWDFGNDVELCVNIEFSNPGILHFFLLVNYLVQSFFLCFYITELNWSFRICFHIEFGHIY